MATAWLTTEEMTAWRTYVETYSDLIAAIEHDLAEHDLTLGDYQVFVYLSETPNRLATFTVGICQTSAERGKTCVISTCSRSCMGSDMGAMDEKNNGG